MLVRADSPDEAYNKAIELGRRSEISYENPEGKSVAHVFRGIKDMNVIHDELEHGAELNYEEGIAVSNEEIERMLQLKEQLTVFRPDEESVNPNCMPKDIADDLERRFGSVNDADGGEI
ncbi:MAG: DUF4288 domain-containing protein [Pyrinomonadaceae bacterium]